MSMQKMIFFIVLTFMASSCASNKPITEETVIEELPHLLNPEVAFCKDSKISESLLFRSMRLDKARNVRIRKYRKTKSELGYCSNYWYLINYQSTSFHFNEAKEGDFPRRNIYKYWNVVCFSKPTKRCVMAHNRFFVSLYKSGQVSIKVDEVANNDGNYTLGFGDLRITSKNGKGFSLLESKALYDRIEDGELAFIEFTDHNFPEEKTYRWEISEPKRTGVMLT